MPSMLLLLCRTSLKSHLKGLPILFFSSPYPHGGLFIMSALGSQGHPPSRTRHHFMGSDDNFVLRYFFSVYAVRSQSRPDENSLSQTQRRANQNGN